METPKDVHISAERHLIILGQHGNLQAKINQLEHMLKVGGGDHFLPYLAEIDEELDYLKRYYPQKDGGLASAGHRLPPKEEEPNPPSGEQFRSKSRIRGALQDMRLLMDAANLAYMTEGSIDCHLKVMLDRAWAVAANEVEINTLDAIPF